MKREVLNDIAAKTRTLIGAPTCSAETKAAAERWLAALDARGRDIPAERETVRENCRCLKLPKGLLREDEK